MSTSRRAPVSWSDLLRYQSFSGAAEEIIEAAKLLGLPQVILPARAVRREKTHKPRIGESSSSKSIEARFRLPLRCPQGFTVRVERGERSVAVKPKSLPDWEPQEAAAVERMLDINGDPPVAQTLLDLPRLQTRWRSILQSRRPGPLDLERMVQALARTEWPAPLPQRPRAYRVQDLHLCVDVHPDRQFLIDDCMVCMDQLIASRPGAQLFLHSIEGPWCWPSVLDSIVSGHAVLLLAEPRLMPVDERRRWRDIEAQLVAQGATVVWSLDWRPEAWAATSDDQPRFVHVLPVGGDLTQSPPPADAADLSRLLACLAPAMTVEPALVRAMIRALRLPGGLALEREVWCHPDLDGALPFRQWHCGPQREYLQRLRQHPPEVIDACWAVLAESHRHRSQVQRDQELLDWADAADEGGVARRDIIAEFDQAKSRYARVAQHLLQLRDHADVVGLTGVSSPGVIRAAAMQRLHSLPECLGADRAYLERLLLQAAQPSDGALSPRGSEVDDKGGPLSVWLFQQGQRLLLVPIDFVGPGVAMTAITIDRRWLFVECDGVSRVIWCPCDALVSGGIELVKWERMPPNSVRVRGVTDRLCIDAVARPHWAAEFAVQPAWAGRWVTDRSNMGWGADGLFHWPDGQPVTMEPSAPEGVVYSTPKGWQFEIDRYGPRLSLEVSGNESIDAQRVYFRYLPPGSYLQGSPPSIGDNDEHPRHPVTLTQGLWLAETPCTQALWQAVMGMNPSHFKDGADAPRRPVENVSWDDATAFLKRLQRLLPPGCEAVLPTESQWEYACRAGTQTKYWWGDEPDDARANWNGQHESTTPVDRYPPNPWGLYDMHGNVWEWCADGDRDYADSPARDPEGPSAGESRVVRGGSWFYHPDLASAASRNRRLRRFAIRGDGFRFALRSPCGPVAPPAGPGPSRRGGAAAPAAEPPRRARGKGPLFRGKDQDKDRPE
ncbi:SUMF1/EgtB/PvdO family nonheme iron enzyme [Lysobacter hankyongensis]|uniref:Sulfatase-modifying factor enzyme-like domain-containing protein n=1 Tax=Lysobacter hankyongensis TaxID=1176535 RepID=A0ABP9C5H4_9GAMM